MAVFYFSIYYIIIISVFLWSNQLEHTSQLSEQSLIFSGAPIAVGEAMLLLPHLLSRRCHLPRQGVGRRHPLFHYLDEAPGDPGGEGRHPIVGLLIRPGQAEAVGGVGGRRKGRRRRCLRR